MNIELENQMIIELDPTGTQTHADSEFLMNALGMIPDFVAMRDMEKSFRSELEKHYGFGNLFEMKGMTIGDDMIFKYPEDEDMPPLAKITSGNDYLLQYDYGIIAIYEKDKPVFVTRMD